MYRIAICRKGQPNPDRRTCATGGELRDIVWEVIRAEGGAISDDDNAGLIKLVGNARDMADIEGFAALEFGDAAITIRPGPAPAPTFPGGGF
jgi:hypothetical protein